MPLDEAQPRLRFRWPKLQKPIARLGLPVKTFDRIFDDSRFLLAMIVVQTAWVSI